MNNGTRKLEDRLKERSQNAIEQARANVEKAQLEKQRADEAVDQLIRERYNAVGRKPLIESIESTLWRVSAEGERNATFSFGINTNFGVAIREFISDPDHADALRKEMTCTGWDGQTNVYLVLHLICDDLRRERLSVQLSEEETEISLGRYTAYYAMSISW